MLTVKEPSTGIEFPLVQKLWYDDACDVLLNHILAIPFSICYPTSIIIIIIYIYIFHNNNNDQRRLGDEFRTVGAAVRSKKIAFIGVKVYAIALYVEAAKAARELGVRDRGGFFESDDDYCSALVDGGFIKALEIELVRDVEGAQFVEAFDEALRPRMSLSGELSVLEQFKTFFQEKKLSKGTTIVLMYRTDAALDVVVRPEKTDFSSVRCLFDRLSEEKHANAYIPGLYNCIHATNFVIETCAGRG